MLRFFKSVKNYYQLYTCIIDFYQHCKEIETISGEELDIFADSIIPLIKQCGCVCIKFAQWLTPVLDLIYNETDKNPPWLLKLERFYENCENHSLEHTKEIYFKEFNVNIDDKYEIHEVIGSGSIGQVYRIKDKKLGDEYAMKILHPTVEYDIKMFKRIFKFLMKFNKVRTMVNDVIPIDTLEFLTLFEKQMDMIHEANNLSRFKYNTRENTVICKTPDLVEFSKSVLIMSYEKGISFYEAECSDYTKGKLIIIFYLLLRYCFEYKDFNHADVHKGNWKLTEDYSSIILYDYGYCYSVNDSYVIKNISTAILELEPNTNNYDSFYKLATAVFKKDDDEMSEVFNKYMKNVDKTYVSSPKFLFNLVIHLSNELNILINPFVFQAIVCQLQNTKNLSKYGITNEHTKHKSNDFIYRSNNMDFINICNTYDIFPELKEYFIEISNNKQSKVDKLFDIANDAHYINDEIKSLLKFD